MIDILIQYKELFLIGLGILIQSILNLFTKRRPKVIDQSLIYRLSEWILQAEGKFRNGDDKLRYVLDEAKNYLGNDYVESDIKKIVEYILTIPQKKEKK